MGCSLMDPQVSGPQPLDGDRAARASPLQLHSHRRPTVGTVYRLAMDISLERSLIPPGSLLTTEELSHRRWRPLGLEPN